MQAERKRAALAAPASEPVQPKSGLACDDSSSPNGRRKRRRMPPPEDEIDAVFHATLGTKIKKGVLAVGATSTRDLHQTGMINDRRLDSATGLSKDRGLQDVLTAIRIAPRGEKAGKKRK